MDIIDKVRYRMFGNVNVYNHIPDISDTLKRNWSVDFEKLMRTDYYDTWNMDFIMYMKNRMIQGPFRYGFFRDRDQPNYDRITSIQKRVKAYKQTRNSEFLVDIANLCMIEFEVCDNYKFNYVPFKCNVTLSQLIHIYKYNKNAVILIYIAQLCMYDFTFGENQFISTDNNKIHTEVQC